MLAAALALAIGMFALPATAALELVDRDKQIHGATTVEWDSSFEDKNYAIGTPITMVVTWDVKEGLATYDDFTLRSPNFTPKGPDPADGEFGSATLIADSGAAPSSGSVSVTFTFTDLHCDEENDVEVGNAHFSLDLNVDTDNDGTTDDVIGHGVNVHVEQPGDCTEDDGGESPPGGVIPPDAPIGGGEDDDDAQLSAVQGQSVEQTSTDDASTDDVSTDDVSTEQVDASFPTFPDLSTVPGDFEDDGAPFPEGKPTGDSGKTEEGNEKDVNDPNEPDAGPPFTPGSDLPTGPPTWADGSDDDDEGPPG